MFAALPKLLSLFFIILPVALCIKAFCIRANRHPATLGHANLGQQLRSILLTWEL
jgi:hypothetical protein